MARVVVMGSAGTSTSIIGAAVAARLRAPYVDGADLWPRPRRGGLRRARTAPQPARSDHELWFDALCRALTQGAVVTTAALTRSGRDSVRHAVPETLFVEIVPDAGADGAREPLTQDERGVRVADDVDLPAVVDRIVDLLGAG
ncbi:MULTISPECIES: shikimate kinase [unclassified Microbacterium]|uniref:shikimate kinase n=1 Tax=unclassified Microbacterium TaxID=2609290 RepID=UPI0030180DAD